MLWNFFLVASWYIYICLRDTLQSSKAHRHTCKSQRCKYVLPAHPRVPFQNDKSIDKLAWSKLKNPNKRASGNYKYGNKLWARFLGIVTS